jgi:uncharacterized protein (TIGR03437 family)
VVAADIAALTTDIQHAYAAFLVEQANFQPNTNQIEAQLNGAILFSRATSALAGREAASPTIRLNLLRIATQLAIAEDYMLFGLIRPATLTQAVATHTQLNLRVTQSTTGQGNGGSPVSPSSQATLNGNTNLDVLTNQTRFPDATWPYEVNGVAVTVGAISVPVLYVSPYRVKFYVSPELSTGSYEVIVTSQEGYVSRGTVTISRNKSKLMTTTDDDAGVAIAANSVKLTTTTIEVDTPESFGSDKRTRLIIFGTGVSGSASNWDPSNDVNIRGGSVRANYAESVSVEARRVSDGQIFSLPVEFAGEQGTVPGLDQINIRLLPGLRGAGLVELTLIINGERSNAPRIVVQ